MSPDQDNAAEKSPNKPNPDKKGKKTSGEIWVELSNPYAKAKALKGTEKCNTLDWSAKDDLRITEDFRKHRNFKRPERKSIWVPFSKLNEYFDSITICRYQDNLNNVAKSYVVKGSGNFGCSIDNKEQTTFFIEILQESKVFRP